MEYFDIYAYPQLKKKKKALKIQNFKYSLLNTNKVEYPQNYAPFCSVVTDTYHSTAA